jgi:hypothetical protein
MSMIKTMTIDGFYSKEEAQRLSLIVDSLPFVQSEFGKEIENFNLTPENPNQLFSDVLNKSVELIEEQSGIFRRPDLFIHFESFESSKEWLFVVALENSTFNIFEHQSGAKNALEEYNFKYRNMFEWDLTVNYLLEPGQGVFFRPWLFHTFDCGLIQTFRLREV